MSLRYRSRALALAAGLFVPVASAAAAPQSQSFGFDNVTQRFTVPPDIHQVHLTAWGGSGGTGGSRSGIYAAPGGLGAKIDLDVPVNPGETLRIDVGGRGGYAFGQTEGDGATAGGSARRGGTGGTVNNRNLDGTAGGGGGGATTVVSGSGATLLIAGGGGGGGGGGASVAGNNGGQGGDAGTANRGACDPSNGPGTYGHGAGGGAGGGCAQPQNGPGGVGGSGEAPGNGAGTGGGGGGGLVGGGGGSAGGIGGGGGGAGGAGTSFWADAATNVVDTNGGPGFGGVVVSWDSAPPAGVPRTRTLGSGQQFTVPPGVSELTILATGGSGGAGGGNAEGRIAPRGGYGAAIRERVTVQPGDHLAVEAGGTGGYGVISTDQSTPILGGSGGSSNAGSGGGGGAVTVSNNTPDETVASYLGGTGGGGGGATRVVNTTTATTLVTAGGGGGGGGGSAIPNAGINGGPGGSAGSPLVSGSAADGDGFFGSGGSTPGTANGAGGSFASSGSTNGEGAANSTQGNARGTGGGGGGGVRGGGAGRQCTGASCAFSAGGGAAGSSAWLASARDVSLGNSLAGDGKVRISWIGKVVTTTALKASADVVAAGAPLRLTATVTGEDVPSGSEPSRTVLFIDEDTGSSLGAPVALSEGQAALTTTLAEGIHHVYAVYEGDDLFLGSTSPRLPETAIPRLSVHSASLPVAVVGARYSATLTATNGTAPYTWSVSDGDLPGGIDLDSATGEIFGTPTTAGTAEFTIRATDAGNPRQSADVPLKLTVNPVPAPAISGVTPDELTAGSENVTVTIAGTHLRPGAELTASDSRITFSSVEVKDATTLTAQVSVRGDTAAGAYDVTVTEGNASATCSGCLRVKTAPVATPTVSPGTPGGETLPAAPPARSNTGPASAPRLTIVRKPAVVQGNRLRFTVRCSGAICSGQVTGIARRRTVATARFTLAAGATRTVTLKLNTTGRALVARTLRLPVTVTVSQRQTDRRTVRINKTRIIIRSRRH